MKQKINPTVVAFAIPVAAVIFAVIFIFFKKANMTGIRDDFPYATFTESPKAFEGNSYILKVQVESQLAYKPDSGRILSVRLESGSRLSVFIPDGTAANIQTGQRYNMYVTIDHNGMLVVKGLEKY